MEGLVHIRLGHGDKVFKTSGHGFPGGMDHTKHGVAVTHGWHDNTESNQIVNLFELDLLFNDLFMDRADMLQAPLNLSINVMFFENVLKLFLHRSNVLVALTTVLR